MNRLSVLLVLFLCGAVFPGAAARAVERSLNLTGNGLVIDDPCARQVTILTDPALRGQAVVHASADHGEEIDRLMFDAGAAAHIRPVGHGGSCWQPVPHAAFTPTLDLTVRIPPDFRLSVDEPGFGRYAVGAVGAIKLDLSGSAVVAIDHVRGDAAIALSGAGTVGILDGEIGRMRLDLSGAGGVEVNQGRVDLLTVAESGAGRVRIGATVGDARVDLSGFGSVWIKAVDGSLRKDISGVGSVTVGGVASD